MTPRRILQLKGLEPPGEAPRVPRQSAQVKCINDKIAALTAVRPCRDVYGALSIAAGLAGDAIAGAMELQEMPGVDVQAFQPTLEFWHRVRDYNYAAALACTGGNQTLAEALVTFRLLRNRGVRLT